jgi:CRISPR-associated protein Csb2
VAVVVTVRLRHGRYEAGGERPSDPEWPPHPARIFCALVASAEGEADWAALRWLETQPAPQVWADPAEAVPVGRARAYVVENATASKGGSQTWPGRKNGMRSRSFAVPATSSFATVWPRAEPPAGVLARLGALARKVPYVGRSTSPAEVGVSSDAPSGAGGWVIYEAGRSGDTAQWQLGVPYPGYTDELQAAYRDGRRAWEVARSVPYTARPADGGADGVADPATAVAGPFEGLMVWSLERPVVRIGGDQAVMLASALRRAVISRIPDPVPAQISGHGADGRPHVGFLVLPDVGHGHADGHILGLALAIPRNLAPADLTALVRAVLMDPLSTLRLSRDQALGLRYGPDRHGLQPARWAAPPGGAREWVTATPLMLDGHLRRGRDEASEVARSLTVAGYPAPARVEVSASPLAAGGVWRPRPGTLPAGRPQRRLVHARVTFAQPVTGPVLAGSMRYLGLGLFLPSEHAAPGPRPAAQGPRPSAGGPRGGPAAQIRPAQVAS